jgi:hypothetical protein
MSNRNYTEDSNGTPARPGTSSWRRTEELPYVLGEATVRQMAHELANMLVEIARTEPGPIVWVTGNSYMPPLRSFSEAERVYQAENNRDGSLFDWFAELVEDELALRHVIMESPEYDNALYVVDVARWQYKSDEDIALAGDYLGDEWEEIPEDDRPHIA